MSEKKKKLFITVDIILMIIFLTFTILFLCIEQYTAMISCFNSSILMLTSINIIKNTN